MSLEGNINQGKILTGKIESLRPVDATLTKQGYAADAKVTGDRLSEINRLVEGADTPFHKYNGAITANSNLNNLLTPGSYSATSSVAKTVLGSPITESAFHVHVFKAAPETSSPTSARPTIQMLTATSPSDERLYWRKHSAGTWSDWNDIGDYNNHKPQGQYYGNGNATARTVEVGGDGKVLMVFGSAGAVFATPYGCFAINNAGESSFIPVAEAYFSNGVLNIITASDVLNKDGSTYPYILL